MERHYSDERTSCYKRMKKRIRTFISAFPSDEDLSIPQSYFASQNRDQGSNTDTDINHSNDASDIMIDDHNHEIADVPTTIGMDDSAEEQNSDNEYVDVNHEDGINNDYDHDMYYDNDNDDNDHDDDSEEEVENYDDFVDDNGVNNTDVSSEEASDDDSNNDNNEDNNDERITESDNTFFNLTNIPNADVFLIPMHNKTVQDHLLASIAMSARHKLTYEATIDNLKWLKSMYHNNPIPTTKDGLWKCLSRNNDILTYHYYCKECHDYLGLKNIDTKKLQRQCQCTKCGPDDEVESDLKSFIYINLTTQIQELLTLPNISNSLKYRFHRVKKDLNAYEDIYDGLEYKSLSVSGKLIEPWYNFSLTINTDGCQVSKSSNSSAWPIYAEINELPPHMRKKHMLLVAIFVDDKHPIMNYYLRPFTVEMQNLFTTGIKWNPSNTSEVTSRLIVTTCSLDAPARAAVTCMKQFNGKFGCLYCFATGRSIGRGKRVYPLSQSYKRVRTDAELRQDMTHVFDTGRIIHGVKNISALVGFPSFDIPKGVVVEAMHAIFLGVVRQHTKLLLTQTATPYYVGNPQQRKLIDKYLLAIKPPSCRSRKPRSISTYVKWKATEWRNWLDYAPVCLVGVLPKKYVEHLALLSESVHHLNSDSISMSNLDRSEVLLRKYVTLFQKFFGIASMTYNIHSLTHLVQVVRNWGPIWAYEAFIFEAWNKRILEFITSPHERTIQIATRFLMQVHNNCLI